ncbi:riboflavin synthase [Neptunicella sp. SCSIO 80796]|uniref:riboflavin synthase n=1 Tax=Neptunicella plasticusilytica TaxID=3117012 RepID=UPI003A4D9442
MFTGIIAATGTIQHLQNNGSDVRLRVNVGKLDMSDVALGDSIATNGVCLTVVEFDQHHFSADVSSETIARSGFAHYTNGQGVNLEKAMLATSRFGGHIVSGHVDGVGEVKSIEDKGKAVEIWVTAPTDLARYIAEKGSVTVDGVSLTINEVNGAMFRLTLVPHTLQETIIGGYKPGSRVNLEVDVIARYLERLMLVDRAADTTKQTDISLAFLAENGYLNKG